MKKGFSLKKPSKADVLRFIKNEPRYLFWDAVGSFIYAVGVYTFAAHADFAPGGVTGMALILNYIFGFPIGSLSLYLNIPIVLGTFRFLGTEYLIRTLQTLVMNAIFLDYVAPRFPSYHGMPLLAAVFAGALSGIGLALIYRAGTCTGGSDLIIMSVRKVKPHFSIGQITLFTDGALILAGAFVYKNVDAVLYGILYTAVSTMVIDKVMNGFIAGKMSFIISEKPRDIFADISSKLGRGATFLKGEGAYTGAEKDVLLCASNKKQLVKIREIVREHDPNALVIVVDYSEVRGEGFLPNND